jgi:hypothetical protein
VTVPTTPGWSVPPMVDDPTFATPARPLPNSLRYFTSSAGGGGTVGDGVDGEGVVDPVAMGVVELGAGMEAVDVPVTPTVAGGLEGPSVVKRCHRKPKAARRTPATTAATIGCCQMGCCHTVEARQELPSSLAVAGYRSARTAWAMASFTWPSKTEPHSPSKPTEYSPPLAFTKK